MNPSDYFDDLVAFEGNVPWMYCDSRGYVTVGIGNLISSPEHAAGLPFRHRGDGPATAEEKASAWAHVHGAFDKARSAAYYQHVSDLRLSDDFIKGLVETRLTKEFIPGIRRLLHDFDSFPLPARKALVDMAYNLGVGCLSHFVNMLSACQARDWATAAHECHRSGARDSRNAWTAQCFIDADVMTPQPEGVTP